MSISDEIKKVVNEKIQERFFNRLDAFEKELDESIMDLTQQDIWASRLLDIVDANLAHEIDNDEYEIYMKDANDDYKKTQAFKNDTWKRIILQAFKK